MLPGVLIVEDAPRLAKNIRIYLERGGFDVRICHSGSEALREFERFEPGIVLLDFKLPGLDGLEVLRRLMSLDHRARVIMMSGVADDQVAIKAKKGGAYAYLVKPLELKALRRLVEKAVAE